MGAHLNAYTSREQTTYYAKVFKKDVAKAVDVLSDILQNSCSSPRTWSASAGVILREMEEVEKEVEEVLLITHATAFQQTGSGGPSSVPPRTSGPSPGRTSPSTSRPTTPRCAWCSWGRAWTTTSW